MHQITGFDLIKTNILVRQTPLSSRLASNRHVGRTVTDKSRVIGECRLLVLKYDGKVD